jgi:Predicted membrane protein (DUF2207) C-terminal domain
MLIRVVEILSGAWLAMIVLTVLVTRPWRPVAGPASLALRGEPPAVVSLLAGRVKRDAYPATLLDLAARGWIGLGEAEPSRVMCLPTAGIHDDATLTEYERRALAHLKFRAAGMGVVPGTALDSGFEIGDDEFRKQFFSEVRADARRRGLLRSRIGRGTLALLEVIGFVAMGLAATALVQHHGAGDIILLLFVYGTVLQAPWALYRRTRLTRAGRAALAEWLGFRVALIGSRSGRTSGTALLAVAGDRRIAYAAALGAAPDAAAAFSASADRNHVWSSFGGSWHRVLLGTPQPKYVPGTLELAGITAFGVLFAAGDLFVLRAEGPLWALVAAVFPGCTWWLCAIWVYGSSARAARLPRLAEFDGQILKLWTEADGEDGGTTNYCIAIDDGMRERAWSLAVGQNTYASSKAGMLVHVRVDPRRNQLLAMSPAGA